MINHKSNTKVSNIQIKALQNETCYKTSDLTPLNSVINTETTRIKRNTTPLSSVADTDKPLPTPLNSVKVTDKPLQKNSGPGPSHTSENSKHIVHTLAQLGTEPKKTIRTLQKRARAKFITNALILKLITLETSLKDSYWNTWHCNSVISQEGKTLTSKYCNNRWCNICNRIRTAKLLNGYYNEINTWQDKWFVTLSRRSVTRKQLKREINAVIEVFFGIKEMMKKRHQRGQVYRGQGKLIGIRKIEITYNNDVHSKWYGTYHLHFHFIIKGRFCAEMLYLEWQRRNGELVHWKGQDIRRADPGSIIELFKYITKIIGKGELSVKALDVIFRAMYGRRIFQTYGGLKRVSEDVDELDSRNYEFLTEQFVFWQWLDYDWVQYDTGELLSEYQPSGKVLELIEKIKKG